MAEKAVLRRIHITTALGPGEHHDGTITCAFASVPAERKSPATPVSCCSAKHLNSPSPLPLLHSSLPVSALPWHRLARSGFTSHLYFGYPYCTCILAHEHAPATGTYALLFRPRRLYEKRQGMLLGWGVRGEHSRRLHGQPAICSAPCSGFIDGFSWRWAATQPKTTWRRKPFRARSTGAVVTAAARSSLILFPACCSRLRIFTNRMNDSVEILIILEASLFVGNAIIFAITKFLRVCCVL